MVPWCLMSFVDDACAGAAFCGTVTQVGAMWQSEIIRELESAVHDKHRNGDTFAVVQLLELKTHLVLKVAEGQHLIVRL